jgi:preprotein translocase subunit SecF
MSGITRLYHGENRYNFVRLWKFGVRASAALFLISVVSLGFRGLNLGIDFKGGTSWETKAFGSVEDTRDLVRPLGLEEAKIQILGTAGAEDKVRVEAPQQSEARQREVRQVLADRAGVAVGDVNVNDVGPTWGGEITQSALRALIVFLLCILGYVTATFRGEWKLAVGVVVAVVHDIVISVGVYSIFQFEVTPATVIAFLTILGYSIYDTVVVYDKVLENSGRVGVTTRMSYTEMMNLSMNQVLLRSVSTSVVSVLPVLSTLVVGAFILGAVTLEEFAIALTVGISIGAYSSVFIAAPVVVWMKEREPRNRQLRERLKAAAERDAKTAADGTPVLAGAGGSSREPSTQAAAARVTDPALYSRNHPPRPRKQGKRR